MPKSGRRLTQFPPIGDASSHDELASQAHADIYGVISADVLVLLNLAKSEGKAVEQGIALNRGIPIVAVGTARTNIFQHTQAYTWVPSVEAALAAVEQLCPV